MKRITRSMVAGLCLAGALLLALSYRQAGVASAATNAGKKSGCTLANLEGPYATVATGTNPGGPMVAVGVYTFDGKGNLSLVDDASLNGDIRLGRMRTGTYTVNPDCTGTLTTPAQDAHLVLADEGREVNYINIRPGNVITGVFKKQFP
jgi:hypothetical protein